MSLYICAFVLRFAQLFPLSSRLLLLTLLTFTKNFQQQKSYDFVKTRQGTRHIQPMAISCGCNAKKTKTKEKNKNEKEATTK